MNKQKLLLYMIQILKKYKFYNLMIYLLYLLFTSDDNNSNNNSNSNNSSSSGTGGGNNNNNQISLSEAPSNKKNFTLDENELLCSLKDKLH